jgi:hypothetical protein
LARLLRYGENWRGQQGSIAGGMNRDYGQRGGQGGNENWRNWGYGDYERSRGYRGGEEMGRWGEQWGGGWRQGPHAGRGPRGYRRSDDRIREEVSDRLTEHGWIDASELDVEVHDCVVTLKGDVDSRQEKRMAEEIAESISGVRDVNNQLHVHEHQQTMQGSMADQSRQSGQAAGAPGAGRNDRVSTRT